MAREIAGEIERIGQIYCEDVLRSKNREVLLLGQVCSPRILYTLLGYELKLGRKRITCPDLTTARYLGLFAEIGLAKVRIPYDPTHTQILLSGLEQALHVIREAERNEASTDREYQRRIRTIYAEIRKRLNCPQATIPPQPSSENGKLS